MNNAAMHIGLQYPFNLVFSHPLDKFLRVVLLDHIYFLPFFLFSFFKKVKTVLEKGGKEKGEKVGQTEIG